MTISSKLTAVAISSKLTAVAIAGALAVATAAPSLAGPMMGNSTAVKAAAPDHVTDVRWRGRGIGPGIAFGLATGALIGSAVAARPYGYYEPDYYYGGPVYSEPYAYEPVYPAPSYGNYYGNRCYTDEGYGRRRPCSAN